jgi:hypothetical protein
LTNVFSEGYITWLLNEMWEDPPHSHPKKDLLHEKWWEELEVFQQLTHVMNKWRA